MRQRSSPERDKSNKIFMQKINAAGGVVQTSDGRVLLIFRNGVWDLPKGKMENGESVEEAAIREVEEETGLKQIRIERSLGNTIHFYTMNRVQIEKTTDWFLMRLPSDEVPMPEKLLPQIEEGITEISWKTKEEAKSIAGYENLIHVLNQI